MNIQEAIEMLNKQRNYGMACYLGTLSKDPTLLVDPPLQIAINMANQEDEHRSLSRLTKFKQKAKLRYQHAQVEDIDYGDNRNLSRQLIEWFCQSSWIDRNENILIIGATGVGKSYLACALANLIIRYGYSALYKRIPRLHEELVLAHADGTLPKLRTSLKNTHLLILDEWGVNQLTAQDKLDLLEIVEDRSGLGSLIITSQIPVDHWHAYIDDPTIADAIMDRIIHRSHTINLSGDSMRKLKESVQEITHV